MENKAYDELLKASLAGTSFAHLVELAASYLNNPLVVIDNSFNIIAYSKNLQSTDFIWLEAVSRGYITIEFGATLNNWDELVAPDQNYFDVSQISAKTRRFIRLKYQNRLVGYLNILEEYTPLTQLDDKVYLFVAALLTKELLFNFQQLNLDNFCIREEEILMELLQDRFADRVHFISRIQGCSLDHNYLFHLGCIDFQHYVSYNAHRSLIQESLQAYIPESTSVFYDKQLVILMKSEEECDYQKLNQFLHNSSLTMGISDPFEDLYQLKIYLKQAQAALRLGALVYQDSQISFYERCKPYHMFERFETNELLRFCHHLVLKLKHYDEKNDTSYVETLRAYLLFQKSIQKTANYLYVHRNTINYRIQKIKEIMGVDLDQYDLDAHMLQSCEIIQYIHFRNRNTNERKDSLR